MQHLHRPILHIHSLLVSPSRSCSLNLPFALESRQRLRAARSPCGEGPAHASSGGGRSYAQRAKGPSVLTGITRRGAAAEGSRAAQALLLA